VTVGFTSHLATVFSPASALTSRMAAAAVIASLRRLLHASASAPGDSSHRRVAILQ
jgi:hypothetical protein